MKLTPLPSPLASFPVRWYGILIALGIVLAFIVVQREMVKRGMHPGFSNRLIDLGICRCQSLVPGFIMLYSHGTITKIILAVSFKFGKAALQSMGHLSVHSLQRIFIQNEKGYRF